MKNDRNSPERQLQETIADAETTLALYEILEDMGEQDNQQAEVSGVKLPKKVLRALKKETRRKKSPVFKLPRRVFVALIAALLVLTGSFAVHAYRKISGWFIHEEKEYFVITPRSVTAADELPDKDKSRSGCYVPTLLPEGFFLRSRIESGHCVSMQYDNGQNGAILFKQYKVGIDLLADNEHMETEAQSVTVGGQPGLYVSETDGNQKLIWGEKGRFVLKGNVDGKVLMEIAEHVDYMD